MTRKNDDNGNDVCARIEALEIRLTVLEKVNERGLQQLAAHERRAADVRNDREHFAGLAPVRRKIFDAFARECLVLGGEYKRAQYEIHKAYRAWLTRTDEDGERTCEILQWPEWLAERQPEKNLICDKNELDAIVGSLEGVEPTIVRGSNGAKLTGWTGITTVAALEREAANPPWAMCSPRQVAVVR